MLRLKLEALEKAGDSYLYNGENFTGVFFDLSNDVVVQAKRLEDGKIIGDYLYDLLVSRDVPKVIDSDALVPENEHDYESFQCLGSHRYSGLALDFDGEFCTAELLYENGWTDSEVTYYFSGQVECVTFTGINRTEVREFFESGLYRKLELSEKSLYSNMVEYSDSGRISKLDIQGKLTDLIGKEIKEKCYAETSFLSGNMINDKFIQDAVKAGVFDRVETLRLYKTLITSECRQFLSEALGCKIIITD